MSRLSIICHSIVKTSYTEPVCLALLPSVACLAIDSYKVDRAGGSLLDPQEISGGCCSAVICVVICPAAATSLRDLTGLQVLERTWDLRVLEAITIWGKYLAFAIRRLTAAWEGNGLLEGTEGCHSWASVLWNFANAVVAPEQFLSDCGCTNWGKGVDNFIYLKCLKCGEPASIIPVSQKAVSGVVRGA